MSKELKRNNLASVRYRPEPTPELKESSSKPNLSPSKISKLEPKTNSCS